MRLKLICVGAKPPTWIQTGIDEYTKRLPKHWHVEQRLLAGADRTRPASALDYQLAEAKLIQAALTPGAKTVVLDEHGQSFSSQTLADTLATWQMHDGHIDFVIGGADGLAPTLIQQAYTSWSLSQLTLPHALARLLLIEQLYRAASLISGHPYHRG